MIGAATVVRFVLTALGLGAGMTAGFFIAPAFSGGDGLEQLGAAVIGALAGSPIGAVAGNLVGAAISGRRRPRTGESGVPRAVLEGLGFVLGLFGGYALLSVVSKGQDIHAVRAVVAIAGAILGFAAGAWLSNRLPGARSPS